MGTHPAAHQHKNETNGKCLFGTSGIYIYSFSIASDGVLTQLAPINAQRFEEGSCGGLT
jgi:hypothetical protein